MSNKLQTATGTATRIKNGRFTIYSNVTGEHRTFEIKTIIADKKKEATAFCNKMAGKRIVSLLTGPDNTRSYTGIGFASDEGITVWQSQMDKTPLAAILWRFATEGTFDPESGRITIEGVNGYMLCEGKCLKCNRVLTVPSSIESGVGPICSAKMKIR